MNRLKLFRFLFPLFILLAVIFGIELIVTDWRNDVLASIGLWSGFISQSILAAVSYSEIRRNKKEQDR